MNVSDAMRLADEMGLPDLRNAYIEDDTRKWGGEKPPCCAIGGAAVASRAFQFECDLNGGLTYASRRTSWDLSQCADAGWFMRVRAGCPACSQAYSNLESCVIHLYDGHEWSRTKIADWLDSVKAREVAS